MLQGSISQGPAALFRARGASYLLAIYLRAGQLFFHASVSAATSRAIWQRVADLALHERTRYVGSAFR